MIIIFFFVHYLDRIESSSFLLVQPSHFHRLVDRLILQEFVSRLLSNLLDLFPLESIFGSIDVGIKRIDNDQRSILIRHIFEAPAVKHVDSLFSLIEMFSEKIEKSN